MLLVPDDQGTHKKKSFFFYFRLFSSFPETSSLTPAEPFYSILMNDCESSARGFTAALAETSGTGVKLRPLQKVS